jgi:hypothetical protein
MINEVDMLCTDMKSRIISIIVFAATLWGCSTTKSSISAEDLRQMKEQSEYLLTIDSGMCTPNLIRLLKMESCYEMVYLNQKYKNYKIVFDSVFIKSRIPASATIIVNGKYIEDKSKAITFYKMRYRIYDGKQPLKVSLVFDFERDTITRVLYCENITESFGPRKQPIDHDMDW